MKKILAKIENGTGFYTIEKRQQGKFEVYEYYDDTKIGYYIANFDTFKEAIDFIASYY